MQIEKKRLVRIKQSNCQEIKMGLSQNSINTKEWNLKQSKNNDNSNKDK